MNLSLRSQLLLWLALAALITAFAGTFVAQEITIWNMESTIDDVLQKRTHMVAAIISSDITTDEASYGEIVSELATQELPFVPLLLRIVSPGKKIIAEFGEVAAPIADSLDYQLQLPGVGEGRLETIKPRNVEPLRVYSIAVLHPQTREVLAFIQAAESLEQVEGVKHQILKNGIILGLGGSLLAVGLGLVLIRRGFRPLRAILKSIDQTDYYNLKANLKKETRPSELEELTRSLTAMWQRLDTTIREKELALGGISHDLKTPLTVLQGQLEVMLLQPSLSAELKDSLNRMLLETRRLIRLVRNLLLNVQLEARPNLVTKELSLRELVDEVVGDIWALAEGLEFDVSAPRDITVYGDRDLLKQVLLNILDNAIKFTPGSGRISLTLTGDNGWGVLKITDTGQGISADDLPHITRPFYRGGGHRKPGVEGAGLGLSIVKQVIELHGGRLDIRSEKNAGTSVEVRLPRKALIVLPE